MWTTMIFSSTSRTRQISWVGEALSLLPCHPVSEGDIMMAKFPAMHASASKVVKF